MVNSTSKADDAAQERASSVERVAQSAWLKIIGTAALTIGPVVVGGYATKILEHLDRIDTFMAQQDKGQALLKQDVDDLKIARPAAEAQMKEIRDMTLQNKFDIEALKQRK